jgi:nicastrin
MDPVHHRCTCALQAEVSEASSHNPGIPPSSLMSFLRVKPSISGVVLEEFNTHFINPFFQSRLDANISAEAVTSAAIVAARALHETAYGTSEVPPLKVKLPSYFKVTSDMILCTACVALVS